MSAADPMLSGFNVLSRHGWDSGAVTLHYLPAACPEVPNNVINPQTCKQAEPLFQQVSGWEAKIHHKEFCKLFRDKIT